jgi:hypothetical protein
VIEFSVTTNVECSHRDTDGRIHGHRYMVEVWMPSATRVIMRRPTLGFAAEAHR